MKARVKATGEIYDIECVSIRLTEKSWTAMGLDEVDVLMPDLTPDYWTRLEHQYAGMAMQGLLSDNVAMEQIVYNQEGMIAKIVANFAFNCATALVEKMKEGRK